MPPNPYPDSAASRPGQLGVSPFRWFRYQPKTALMIGLPLMAFLLGGIFWHWVCWFFAPIPLYYAIQAWQNARRHFWHGNTCPGVVLSSQPYTVAYITDLSKGSGEYPAVKIVRTRPLTAGGVRVEPGSKVIAIATYYRSEHGQLYWDDFCPFPIEYATGRVSEIERLVASVDREDWKEMRDLLKFVPTPDSPGLYLIKKRWRPSANPPLALIDPPKQWTRSWEPEPRRFNYGLLIPVIVFVGFGTSSFMIGLLFGKDVLETAAWPLGLQYLCTATLMIIAGRYSNWLAGDSPYAVNVSDRFLYMPIDLWAGILLAFAILAPIGRLTFEQK